MTSARSRIVDLIEQGAIAVENVDAALAAARVTPDGRAWRTFIDQLLLWTGGLALACAVLFFIAYNWNDIGRLARFGMVEALIVLCVAVYCRLAQQEVAGKVALLVASVLLGVLLALYGQTYQTGADSWQMFSAWALLMLPWALIGRFPAIWLVWITLVNLSIVLYYQTFQGMIWLLPGFGMEKLWLLFCFNTLTLIAWELLALKRDWLAAHWAVRLVAVGSGFSVTMLVLHAIVAYGVDPVPPALVWAVWLTALYIVYRRLRHDLFMLAGACLSAIVVVAGFLARHLLPGDTAIAFLLLAVTVIGLGSGAGVWLRKVNREWQS